MRHEGFHGRAGFGRRPALLVVDINVGFTDPASPARLRARGRRRSVDPALLDAAGGRRSRSSTRPSPTARATRSRPPRSSPRCRRCSRSRPAAAGSRSTRGLRPQAGRAGADEAPRLGVLRHAARELARPRRLRQPDRHRRLDLRAACVRPSSTRSSTATVRSSRARRSAIAIMPRTRRTFTTSTRSTATSSRSTMSSSTWRMLLPHMLAKKILLALHTSGGLVPWTAERAARQ